jgi:hypothetical protein
MTDLFSATALLSVLFILPASAGSQAALSSFESRSGFAIQADIRTEATKNGQADGLKAGRQDRQRSRTYSYASHDDYKSGLRGYNPKMGSRKVYKAAYRKAYENSYREGWNGY